MGEVLYDTPQEPEEITKEQYVEGMEELIFRADGITKFILDFELQDMNDDFGVIGNYVDFLNKYDSTEISLERDVQRKFGSELFQLFCRSVSQLSTGELVQNGTLKPIKPTFLGTYLKALYELDETMNVNLKCLSAAYFENYRYFKNQEGIPLAIPSEQIYDPPVDNSDGMFV
ncbi:MAG: hypothetical protein KAR20_25005 [Candidatus Heimdallarchaeota archaeon]|nr:hypothetical protein [Candidatus Heimdallarchaeota archaeon]